MLTPYFGYHFVSGGKHSKRDGHKKSSKNNNNNKNKKCKNEEDCQKRQYPSLQIESTVDLRPYYDPHWNDHSPVAHHETSQHHGGLHEPGLGGHGTYPGPQHLNSRDGE